jgi:hypothetical protein
MHTEVVSLGVDIKFHLLGHPSELYFTLHTGQLVFFSGDTEYHGYNPTRRLPNKVTAFSTFQGGGAFRISHLP